VTPVVAPADVAPPAPVGPSAAELAIAVGPDVRTTRVVPTKAFNASQAALGAVDDARKVTAGAETKLKTGQAADILADEQQQATDREELKKQQEADKAKIQSQVEAATKTAADLREKHGKDYEKPFFEGKGVATKWLAALSVGLGAYAATVNKGPNFAWNIMSDAMDRHAARERARLQQQKEEIERAGGDVTKIEAQLRDFDRVTVPQQQAALLQSAGDRRRLLLAKYGADQAKIDGDKLLQQIEIEKQTRIANVQAGLASKVETDNSALNKAKRDALAGPTAEKLSERQQVGATGIEGALQAVRAANKTKDFSAKEREAVENFIGEARQLRESDPEKFRGAINKLAGNYYNQLSENGKTRFNHIQQAAQDLERVLSGGVINPHEFASRMSLASKPGGLTALTDRAHAMATGLPPASRDFYRQEINKAAQEVSVTDPKIAAGNRAAAVAQLRNADKLPPARREALEWVRANPGDTRAAGVLAKGQ
jgi:hypothetical protein